MYEEISEAEKAEIDKFFAENYTEDHRKNTLDPHFALFNAAEYIHRAAFKKNKEEKNRAREIAIIEYRKNAEQQMEQTRQPRAEDEERNRLAKLAELNESILEKITELNDKFRTTNLCLELKIDETTGYIEFSTNNPELRYPTSRVLCLIDTQSKSCLSSIEYNYLYKMNVMFIDSETREDQQKKKYNLLLRAVIFLSTERFVNNNPGFRAASIPINPISLYILIKYFRFRFRDGNPKQQEIDSLEEITLKSLEKYRFNQDAVYLVITDEALDNARKIIDELLDTGKIASVCIPTEGGRVFRKKRSHRYRKPKGQKTKNKKKQKSTKNTKKKYYYYGRYK